MYDFNLYSKGPDDDDADDYDGNSDDYDADDYEEIFDFPDGE